jgi:hypothetical protein
MMKAKDMWTLTHSKGKDLEVWEKAFPRVPTWILASRIEVWMFKIRFDGSNFIQIQCCMVRQTKTNCRKMFSHAQIKFFVQPLKSWEDST